MSLTFGGATGDDVTWTSGLTLGATTRNNLVCGWWRPTTLTATRRLWSAGTIFGAEIAAATSEIVLRTDNTTDGQWTTTGAGLTLNQWQFLAFVASINNTGPAAAWRVWSGTIDTAPIECTVTQNTAPVGNFTGSGSFTIGNAGSAGTVAFQGDIANVAVFTHAAVVGADRPFGNAAFGAITATEAQYLYERFVLPFWLGDMTVPNFPNTIAGGSQWTMEFAALDGNAVNQNVLTADNSGGNSFIAATLSGAAASQLMPPRPVTGLRHVSQRYKRH